MAKQIITNSEIITIFEQIELIKDDPNLSEKEKTIKVKQLQDSIVEKLDFLVYTSAKKYRKFQNYEDLVQEGFIGLLRAARKFNYKLFPNFFIYSERWIKHRIRRAASKFDIVYSPDKTRVVYAEPSENRIDIEPVETPEEIFFNKEAQKVVKESLKDFSNREQEIVEKIFGLDDGCPQTLRGIGPSFNLTHERIRQIKNQVIEKLRKDQNISDLYQ